MSHYDKVPKDPVENLKFRRFLMKEAHASPVMRKALWQACKEDILFWFNAFCWTYDPREPDTAVPFITYPFQDEAILSIRDCIYSRRQLVMQKSRDMGASWMCVGVMDHEATFERGKRFVMMSYQADLVDKKGNPKSLFWKLDFIHKHLPSWLKPSVQTRILGREYESSDSTVDGVATTNLSSIGDRATAIFIDEFSKFDVPEADSMLSGLADVSRCRIWNFTKNTTIGKAHPSYQLIDQVNRGEVMGLRMHWTQHPVKSRGLYRVDKATGLVTVHDQREYNLVLPEKPGDPPQFVNRETGYAFPRDFKFQTDNRFEWHSILFDFERKDRGNDRYMSEQWEIEDDGASFTVFDPDLIKDYIRENCRPPFVEGILHYDALGKNVRFEKMKGGPIKLWTDLDANGKPPAVKYGGGADISLGRGATNSCFSMARADTGEKILEVATPRLKPDEFAVLVVAICHWFSSHIAQPLLAWERQGPGEAFGSEVLKLGYSEVFFEWNENQFTKVVSKTAGWNPTKSSAKESLLTRYRSSLSRRDFLNRSEYAMLETMDWIDTGKGPTHKDTTVKGLDPSGAATNHGDRVIADALCDKMLGEIGGERVIENKPRVNPIDAFVQAERDKENRSSVLYANWNRKQVWRAE